MAERFINPLESQPLVSGGVQAPRLNHQYGAIQKTGQDISNSLLKIYEESKVNLKNSYLSDYMKDVNEFESKMQYDKSYYQDPSKIAELKERLETKQNEFKKMAEELEFFPEDMEEITSRTDALNLRVDTAYKTKYTQWREQELREDFLANQQQTFINIGTEMLLGYSDKAVKSFINNTNSLSRGIKADQITEEEAAGMCIRNRAKLIEDNVLSYANTEEAEKIYEEMARMTSKDFVEKYKDLIFNLEGKEYSFTEYEYGIFRNAISSGLQRVRAKREAVDFATKIEQGKYEKNKIDKPLTAAFQELGVAWGTPIATRPDVMILATNNANNLDFPITGNPTEDFETLKEISKLGIPIITTDKNEYFESKEALNNGQYPELGLLAYSKDVIERTAGIEDTELKENIINSLSGINDTYIPNGYRTLTACKEYKATFDAISNIFSPQNIEILKNPNTKNFSVIPSMEIYELNQQYKDVRDYTNSPTMMSRGKNAPTPVNQKRKYDMLVAGKMAILKQNSTNDVNTKRLSDDLEKMANAMAKVMIYNKLNGVIPKDLLDDLSTGKEKLPEGTTINELSADKQTMFYKIMSNEKNFQKEFNREFEPVFNEITKGLGFLEIGNGRTLIVPEKFATEENAGAIVDYIKSNTLRTKDGRIVSPKSVKVKSFLNEDNIMFTYGVGEELYTNNGKMAIYHLGDKK